MKRRSIYLGCDLGSKVVVLLLEKVVTIPLVKEVISFAMNSLHLRLKRKEVSTRARKATDKRANKRKRLTKKAQKKMKDGRDHQDC